MKKLVRKKFRSLKSVNNHKIQIYHKLRANKHIVNGELGVIYKQMLPIYQELDFDFQKADLIDLEFYERWLNG